MIGAATASMFIFLFWLFLLSASMSIVINGGRVERGFLALIVLAIIATITLDACWGIIDAAPFVSVVDALLLLAALALVLTVDQHWPIWFAGFQLITVATELAHILFPNDIPGIYVNASRLWSLPAILAMAVGVLLDKRSRGRPPRAR